MRRIAIDEYFAEIAAENITDVLRFFTEDARFNLYPHNTVHVGHHEIADMYRGVFARHHVIEREVLDCVCDVEQQSLMASFKATTHDSDGGSRIYFNVNFWQFSGSRFSAVKVFMSDPAF